MNIASENTILVFMEDGKDLTDLLEQIFRILANSTEKEEKNVP